MHLSKDSSHFARTWTSVFAKSIGDSKAFMRRTKKREQEYVFIREQLSRQEIQLADISKELGRHTQYFDDLDNRVAELEKKSA